MLDPTRPGENLAELFLRGSLYGTLLVKHNRLGVHRPLVKREDVFHGTRVLSRFQQAFRTPPSL
jgi:hypothetical protein